MRRTGQRQGPRMLKHCDVLSRRDAAGLNQMEAAELLRMRERTFRRGTRRFEKKGEVGLLDRRLGARSGRAVPEGEVERLYRERYAGFTATHFHEHLPGHHGFRSATLGPRPTCGTVARWPRRRAAGPIGASGRAGRWRARCCIRTARPTPSFVARSRSISSSRSTTPPARFIRRSWLRRKVRFRAFSA